MRAKLAFSRWQDPCNLQDLEIAGFQGDGNPAWNLERELPYHIRCQKTFSQMSPNPGKVPGMVLHDRNRKQTYDGPDEVGTLGFSEFWALQPLPCDKAR